MYLTGGQYKGCKIVTPNGVKPTLSKVRESVFNMLSSLEHGNKFLDMFAGSAIMGLEAYSRGYSVKEIELNPKTASIIKQNYQKLKAKADISICSALKYIGDTFDIIYLDPPWNNDYIPIIKHAYNLLNPQGLIIVEFDFQNMPDIQSAIKDLPLEIIKEKKYGRCIINILRNITKTYIHPIYP